MLLADARTDVVLGAAAVLAASAVVWVLLGWAVLVGVAMMACRLPGAAGRGGQRLLVSITPRTIRSVVVVATGVSLAAGIGACGGPASQAVQRADVPAAAADTSAPSAQVGSWPDGEVVLDLDWPQVAPRTVSEATGSAGRGPSGPPVQPPGADSATDGAAWATVAGPAAPDGKPSAGVAGLPPAAAGLPPSRTSAPVATPAPPMTQSAGPAQSAERGTDHRSADGGASAGPGASRTDGAGPRAADGRSGAGRTDDGRTHGGASDESGSGATGGEQTAGGATGQSGDVDSRGADAGAAGPADGTSAVGAADVEPGQGAEFGHNADAGQGAEFGHNADAGKGLEAQQRAPDTGTVVVRPGDCLWDIAAAHLPAGASPAQIDAAWRAWYATNRQVIGANPNLVIPGQRLRAPAAEAFRSPTADVVAADSATMAPAAPSSLAGGAR